MDECVRVGEEIGYPVIARAAFSLGGLGSGFVNNSTEMRTMAAIAFATSPQVCIVVDVF